MADKPSAASATEPAATGLGVGLIAKLKEKLFYARQKKQQKITANLEKIMAYALEHERITNTQAQAIIRKSHRQTVRYLNQLLKQDQLTKFGTKSNIFYKPNR
jgi:predicted HTH transcriptional regulator